jgi:hypothetical protein
MIILFTKGRLGNVLFQYSFILKNFPKHLVITNRSNFFQIFRNPFISLIRLNSLASKILNRIFLFLSNVRLISSINEISFLDKNKVTYKNIYKKGVFSKIVYVNGFFQNAEHQTKVFQLKENHLRNARNYLEGFYEDQKKIFVHVREGDYNKFVLEEGEEVKLPYDYYFHCIEKIDEKFGNCLFIFLSDEIEKAKKIFKNVSNAQFVNFSIAEDLALMSLCDGAIISNSSFSWWGAFLIENPILIMAPKFWLGWQKKIWIPSEIATKKFNYINVK